LGFQARGFVDWERASPGNLVYEADVEALLFEFVAKLISQGGLPYTVSSYKGDFHRGGHAGTGRHRKPGSIAVLPF
jgi:hypothetical protein